MHTDRAFLMPRGALVEAWARAEWHPQSLLLDDTEAIDPDATAVARFVATADRALGTPWPDVRLSDYARYPRDGDRSAYESATFARMDRVATAVVAAVATGRVEFLDEAADGLYAICEQSTWCWPAHDDVFARSGEVVADRSRPYVDLGAGEMAALLAWARFALGAALDARFPGLTRRMGAEVDERILAPFLERRDWHWLGLHGRIHNWNPWIHGNVIVAAAAFADPGITRVIVDLAVEGIDRYLAALPADGAIDEGFGYWWNGAARALDALEVLDRAAGGTLDVGAVTGLDELLRFPLRSQLGLGWVLGFADAEPRASNDHPWRIPHHWGRRLGLDDVVAHASGFERGAPDGVAPNVGLGRILSALADRDWARASAGAPALPASVVFPSLRLALARQRSGSPEGLAISLKGGHNDENHNHNDLGSVTVTLDGIPAVIDIGRPTYDARTFGPDRYTLWTMRSDWHSVPEPRGALQQAGARWRTGELRGEDDGSGIAEWALDLGDAWGLEADGGERWIRRIRLDREASAAEVHDEWSLAEHPDTRTTWIAWADVEEAGPTTLRIRRPVAGSRDVLVDHDAATVAIEVREIDDPVIAHSWGERLTRVRLSPPPGASSMTVRFRADDGDDVGGTHA
ncbi:heparinase II/III family protein [Agromyces sp. Soil535]|uniref:heparinase II/III family protein n=1 Tax=Agromyces sp. Soil535 TaxID=1736390 RepID=UPI0006FC3936|nr:heparinase II/III family protein [Agromyces sp. Soil535]KRE28897.1 hypothetical protein ASG80_20710 [Agromyces sp. Soil535]